MSRPNLASYSPLGQIFTKKRFPDGYDYDKNGIWYKVSPIGRGDFLKITESAEVLCYQDMGSGLFQTDESFSDQQTEANTLNPQQVAQVLAKVDHAVNHEALEIGLSEENARIASDFLVSYLKGWKINSDPLFAYLTDVAVKKRLRQAAPAEYKSSDHVSLDVNAKFLELQNSSRLDLAYSNHDFVKAELSRNGSGMLGEEEKQDYVERWIQGRVSDNMDISIQSIWTRYFQIRNFTESHQINALDFGLTDIQAEAITEAQFNYLDQVAIDRGGVTGAQMQESYNRIQNLREAHQIEAFDLGLTEGLARNITSERFNAAVEIFNTSNAGQETGGMTAEISFLDAYHQSNPTPVPVPSPINIESILGKRGVDPENKDPDRSR